MPLKKQTVDELEQDFLIKRFCKKNNIILLESPIVSIDVNQLKNKECIPDAIINCGTKKEWLELTTVSRCAEMRKQMGDLAKHPERFDGMLIIPGIPAYKFESLQKAIRDAFAKKAQKNYAPFAKIAQISEDGTLLISVRINDIFLTGEEFRELVDVLKDRHMLFDMGIYMGQFRQIMLDAVVYNSNSRGWDYNCAQIADADDIIWAKKKYETKQLILAQFNARKLSQNPG